MAVLSVSKAKENLEAIVEEVQNSYEPMIISGQNHSAVLVSEEVWRSIEETLYLSSIPGMKESIIKGMAEKVEECASSVEW